MPVIAIIAAATGVSAAIGAGVASAIGLGTVSTLAATAIGSGIIAGGMTAIQGGDAGDVLKSAVLGGVGSYVGGSIGEAIFGGAESGISQAALDAANATSDPIAALNAVQGWTGSDISYLQSIGASQAIIDAAISNNAALAGGATVSKLPSQANIDLANATSDPIAALNAAEGWTASDIGYLHDIGAGSELINRAIENNLAAGIQPSFTDQSIQAYYNLPPDQLAQMQAFGADPTQGYTTMDGGWGFQNAEGLGRAVNVTETFAPGMGRLADGTIGVVNEDAYLTSQGFDPSKYDFIEGAGGGGSIVTQAQGALDADFVNRLNGTSFAYRNAIDYGAVEQYMNAGYSQSQIINAMESNPNGGWASQLMAEGPEAAINIPEFPRYPGVQVAEGPGGTVSDAGPTTATGEVLAGGGDQPFRVEVAGTPAVAGNPDPQILEFRTPGTELATEAQIDSGQATWNPAANAWEIGVTPPVPSVPLDNTMPGVLGSGAGVGITPPVTTASGAGQVASVINPNGTVSVTYADGTVINMPAAGATNPVAGVDITGVGSTVGAGAGTAAGTTAGTGLASTVGSGVGAGTGTVIGTGTGTGPVTTTTDVTNQGSTGGTSSTTTTPTEPVAPTTPTTPTTPVSPTTPTTTTPTAPEVYDYTNPAAYNQLTGGTGLGTDIASGLGAAWALSTLGQPGASGARRWSDLPPLTWGKVQDLVNPGLNPGWMPTRPYYQPANDTQSKYYWGQHPYMATMGDLEAPQPVIPEAQNPAWGSQSTYQPFDVNRFIAQNITQQNTAALAGQATPVIPVQPQAMPMNNTMPGLQIDPATGLPIAGGFAPVAP